MGVSWTEEQKKVIDLRDCNILVSAAAGSGKTAVLVERILTMLMSEENPVDIDRLLIVTFTNAAASEMKDRIREAIEKKLEEEELPSKVQEHLQRQTALLANAQISTIHSFCQYVIRNHFHTIDLDPNFRIADEGEQKLLRQDVLNALLEECYKEGNREFLEMSERVAVGRDDKELADMVLQLYEFSMSFPWPEKWLKECEQAYDLENEEVFYQSGWMKQLVELVHITLEDVLDQMKEAKNLILDEDGPWMYEEALDMDQCMVQALLKAQDYPSLSQAFAMRDSWTRLSAKKDESVSDVKREMVKEIRAAYKDTVNGLEKEYFFATGEELYQQMKKMAPMVNCLVELTMEFTRRFTEEKRRKNLCDFNDLEHLALSILLKEENGEIHRTPVAEDFSAYYQEIMIDEYQDSNMVQEMILNSISGVPMDRYNIFMVGDVKQSIYRFRLARPELFMEKFRTYSLETGNCRRVDLHRNFRSREQVLTSVNFIFEQIMEEHLGNVQYDEAAALHPGAVFEEAPKPSFYDTEVWMLDLSSQAAEESEESARELEARVIGNRIQKMLGKEMVWDKEQSAYRPVRYGDCVILLRTISGWAEVFAKVLGEMGIPAHTGSRTGYFSALEVQTVIAMLKVLDNPRQDVPLTAVLYSPMAGISGEELAGIRSRHPKVPFYEACMEEESLKPFFAMIEDLRKKAVYMPMHELLWEILDRTGYGRYAAAMPGGEQRKANLDMLVEKAITYESGSYRGLYNFIRYIENLHKYDVDFGEASLGNEAEDTVRIMSIHKSKGLEFPVVFAAGMGKNFNQTDARSSMLLHADLGIGCDYVDAKNRIRTNTLLKKVLKTQIARESLGEELRVLYVALTRAKEKLILTGSVSDLSKKMKKWGEVCRRINPVLSVTQRAQAGSFWDWVIPALMRNQCMENCLQDYDIQWNPQHPLWKKDICCQVEAQAAEQLLEKEAAHQVEYKVTKEILLHMPYNEEAEEAKEIQERFSYEYPFAQSSEIPSKVSVSELKKFSQTEEMNSSEILYEEPAPVPLVPEYLKEEREIGGAFRGTVYHKFMECLDFSALCDKNEEKDSATEKTQLYGKIKKQIAAMIQKGQLTREESLLLDMRSLMSFVRNPLAERMAAAEKQGMLFREQQFVLQMDAADMREEWHGGETVLIQGIIDAFFIEADEIVLVDYKTDYVKKQEASSLFEKYRVQLEYYERALEQLTGKKVKEKMIYSFCLDCVIKDDR